MFCLQQPKSKPYGTVLLKASKIMDYLANHPNRSLQAIAKATDMTNSTTLKILETLILVGYIRRDKDKTYRLGSKLIKYANQAIENIDLVEFSKPYLEKLQLEIDETIHLGILENNEIFYVNKLDPQNQTIRMSSHIGITKPLYCSAMGKAVLATFSEEEFKQYINKTSFVSYTAHTITSVQKLASELAEIRKSQIAFDDEETEKDIFCIGTALVKNNNLLGAISISLPKYRLTEEFKETISKAVVKTKYELENKWTH